MGKIRLVSLVGLILFLALAAGSCSTKFQPPLVNVPQVSAEHSKGRVLIGTFRDRRSEIAGEPIEKTYLGTVRSGVGISLARIEHAEGVNNLMKDTFVDSLRYVGFMTDVAPKTIDVIFADGRWNVVNKGVQSGESLPPILVGDIKRLGLWYSLASLSGAFQVRSDVALFLVEPNSGKVLWNKDLSTRRKYSYGPGKPSAIAKNAKAFMIRTIQDKVINIFSELDIGQIAENP